MRDTAKAWSRTERAIADAIRQSLVDMILQMRALRALIAEQQAMSALAVVQHGAEPMILASGDGHILLANDAFLRMLERPTPPLAELDDCRERPPHGPSRPSSRTASSRSCR